LPFTVTLDGSHTGFMSERLRHLHRQRGLLQEHLSWIESEIVRETGAPPVTVTTPPVPVTVPLAGSSAEIPSPDVDALIDHYAAQERQKPSEIRRGCLLVFSAALLLFAVVFASIWLLYYRSP
jgi:hypothetical protein